MPFGSSKSIPGSLAGSISKCLSDVAGVAQAVLTRGSRSAERTDAQPNLGFKTLSSDSLSGSGLISMRLKHKLAGRHETPQSSQNELMSKVR